MKKRIRFVNGYVLVYRPKHPSSMSSENWQGWVYEHIYVAEKKLGRPLRSDEVVHHLDHNRANNIRRNLLVLPKSSHTTLHEWLRSGAKIGSRCRIKLSPLVKGKEFSKLINRCEVCGFTVKDEGDKFCSKKCQTVSSRTAVDEKLFGKAVEEGMPWTKIGKRFGVSDNGARKIAKRLGYNLATRSR